MFSSNHFLNFIAKKSLHKILDPIKIYIIQGKCNIYKPWSLKV